MPSGMARGVTFERPVGALDSTPLAHDYPSRSVHTRDETGITPECGADAQPWTYQGDSGPANWSSLSDTYNVCGSGDSQSPVDISVAEPARLPPLSFQYRSSSLVMVNTGQTIRIDYEPGSHLRVGGTKYELLEFHFHTPSEHTFNGRNADMEIHLVHRDGLGNYAVVAVPVVAGRRHNILMSRVWQHLPRAEGGRYSNSRIGIKPIFLLPTDRGYYSYPGSLTTPPCTEGVRWFVLKQPLEVPARYIQEFQEVIGRNARPIQKLNARPVLASH